jgi:hypothetical protein
MNSRRFENVNEFKDWSATNLNGAIIYEYGEFDTPMMYPCIMVYEFIEQPYCNCADDFEQFDNLRNEDYDSEDIEKLIYHYIYPTDFD